MEMKFDKDGALEIHRAAHKGDYKRVLELLDAGIDPNTRTENGCCPYDFAYFKSDKSAKHMETAKLIKSRGGVHSLTLPRHK